MRPDPIVAGLGSIFAGKLPSLPSCHHHLPVVVELEDHPGVGGSTEDAKGVLPVQNLQVGHLPTPFTLSVYRGPLFPETAPGQPYTHDHRTILGEGADISVAFVAKIQADQFFMVLEDGLATTRRSGCDGNQHLLLTVAAVRLSGFGFFGHGSLFLPFPATFTRMVGGPVIMGSVSHSGDLTGISTRPPFLPTLSDLLYDPAVVLLHLAGGHFE
jgi:hypothetical protein